jgi:hypothetical protein
MTPKAFIAALLGMLLSLLGMAKDPEVTMKEGTTLETLATAAYGHPKFAAFLARLNGISNPDQIAVGTVLKTPPITQALKDAGLAPPYQTAADSLAKAWADFQAASPAYQKARDASGITSDKFPIPPEISTTLSAAADAVDTAVKVLSNPAPGHQAPQKTIGQLTQCASQLRGLATGAVDGYGYDHDMVGQRFALAFTGLLVWVQARHH